VVPAATLRRRVGPSSEVLVPVFELYVASFPHCMTFMVMPGGMLKLPNSIIKVCETLSGSQRGIFVLRS
jgi:hypothetical protein